MTEQDVPTSIIDTLKAIVGPSGWLSDAADLTPYVSDSRQLFHGNAALVVRPRSTSEVSRIVRACASAGVAVYPSGGRTGLVGGGVPANNRRGIVISLERMADVRAVDTIDNTMVVEAGCVLASAQKAAASHARLLPLRLNAEGSCTIGGNISTNAGGIQVLRYGSMRDLVLGLEVVLPTGEVWDGMRALRKDNAGYALKHLFIGAEGTLGIVTAAVLKLFPQPSDVQTAFVGIRDVQEAVTLLSELRTVLGDQLSAFEIMSRFVLECGTRHTDAIDPLANAHPWYVLLELSGSTAPAGTPSLRAALLSALETALEKGRISDAVVAESLTQAAALWRLRESTWEGQACEGPTIKHDVAVPIAAIPSFINRATAACQTVVPGARIYAFGHIGDGNIHFNLLAPASGESAALQARTPDVNRAVHDIVADLNGTISAEHGIGRLKREEMARYKSPVEIRLMRAVKNAFDPSGLLNPGHIFL